MESKLLLSNSNEVPTDQVNYDTYIFQYVQGSNAFIKKKEPRLSERLYITILYRYFITCTSASCDAHSPFLLCPEIV